MGMAGMYEERKGRRGGAPLLRIDETPIVQYNFLAVGPRGVRTVRITQHWEKVLLTYTLGLSTSKLKILNSANSGTRFSHNLPETFMF